MTATFSDGPSDITDGFRVIVGASGFLHYKVDPATGAVIQGCHNAATNDTWRCRQYGAAACSLYPRVRTYTAKMEAGVFHEEQMHETPYLQTWGGDAGEYFLAGLPSAGIVDLKCIDENQSRALR